MKIVCDACQAKYSISDDKVQGKVFKIRCKKCSNIIVVRGGTSAAEPAPAPQQEKDTRVYDYGYDGGDRAPSGDEAVWHVVINQDQVGPMAAVDVRQRFTDGEIDSETYVWREGFADWMPLAQVDTFAGLLASGSGASPRGSGAEAVASMFGGGGDDGGTGRSDPGDLFAAASASAHQDDGGDLFGGKPAAQPSAGATKLRGERNENSVLFSLNNLAQLASDKPAPVVAHAAPSSIGAATGPSGGEGSGLIDIRSMASAYLGNAGSAAKPASAGIGSIDDLPVFGGGGFSEPAVIVPIAARPNPNKLMYALIGSVGLLAVAAVIVVVVLLRSNDAKPTRVASVEKAEPVDKAPPAPSTPDPAARPPEPGTGRPPESAAATGNDGAGQPGANKAADSPDAKRTPAPAHRPTTPSPGASTASATTAPPPRPKQPDKAPAVVKDTPPPKDTPKDSGKDGGCDEVSCVLNNYEGACCAKFRKGGGKAAAPSGSSGAGPRSDLPESLDRTMISDGLAKVKAKVMSCGDKSPAKGQVKVSVKVSPDGRITNVTVKNTPDANLGNCVSAQLQSATFGKTQTGGAFAIPYTF